VGKGGCIMATLQTKKLSERKIVGKVTYQERDQLQGLFERKNGLIELVYSLAIENDELLKNHYFYEKLVADMGRTTTKLQQWWDEKGIEYKWQSISGYVWSIDFETCQIFLQEQCAKK